MEKLQQSRYEESFPAFESRNNEGLAEISDISNNVKSITSSVTSKTSNKKSKCKVVTPRIRNSSRKKNLQSSSLSTCVTVNQMDSAILHQKKTVEDFLDEANDYFIDVNTISSSNTSVSTASDASGYDSTECSTSDAVKAVTLAGYASIQSDEGICMEKMPHVVTNELIYRGDIKTEKSLHCGNSALDEFVVGGDAEDELHQLYQEDIDLEFDMDHSLEANHDHFDESAAMRTIFDDEYAYNDNHCSEDLDFVKLEKNSAKRCFSTIEADEKMLKNESRNTAPGPYYRSAVDVDLNSEINNTFGLSLMGGLVNNKEEEYMSSRRRRRLNQIVPNPRKPRSADYSCSLCSESYTLTVVDNPWWAVYSHECPKCKQNQIPRIDINAASNAIELDPNIIALYGEGVEDSGDEDENEYSDEEEEEGENIAENEQANSVNAPDEEKPFDGDGLLAKEEASKLLVLMCHARTCTGAHSSEKHAEICKSTKFLMLHIRDCKGIDIHGRDCQFPWCKPCKKMLRHLTQCYEPDSCTVCNPW